MDGFVNNREETIAKGVAKAISRCGDAYTTFASKALCSVP